MYWVKFTSYHDIMTRHSVEFSKNGLRFIPLHGTIFHLNLILLLMMKMIHTILISFLNYHSREFEPLKSWVLGGRITQSQLTHIYKGTRSTLW